MREISESRWFYYKNYSAFLFSSSLALCLSWSIPAWWRSAVLSSCLDPRGDKIKTAYCTIIYKFSVDNFRNTFDHNTWTKPINTSTKQNYSDPRNCPAIKNVAIGTLMFQYFDCYYYDAISTIWSLTLWVSLIEGRHNDCHAKTLCPIPNVHFHFPEGSIPHLRRH